MSLLLDALRRGHSGGGRPEASGRLSRADQVLATLGYSSRQQARWRVLPVVLVVGVAALVGVVFWGALLLFSPQPTRQSTAATQKQAPVHPESAISRPDSSRAGVPTSQSVAGAGTTSAPQVIAPVAQPSRAAAPAPQPVALLAQQNAATRATPPGMSFAQQQRAAAPAVQPIAPSASPRRIVSTPTAAARPTETRTAPQWIEPSSSGIAAATNRASVRRSATPRAPVSATEAVRPDDFRLALYYQRSGDFERALTHYRGVLERNELNAEAHNNLGLLYEQKGLTPDAVREFQRAIAINARYSRAHNNLGVAFMRRGDLDLARAELQTALSIDARDTDALVNLALVEKAAQRRDAAKTTLIRALAIDPADAAAHYNLALLYDESGETARAVEHYRDFLQHAGVDHAELAPEVRARVDTLASGLR